MSGFCQISMPKLPEFINKIILRRQAVVENPTDPAPQQISAIGPDHYTPRIREFVKNGDGSMSIDTVGSHGRRSIMYKRN